MLENRKIRFFIFVPLGAGLFGPYLDPIPYSTECGVQAVYGSGLCTSTATPPTGALSLSLLGDTKVWATKISRGAGSQVTFCKGACLAS